jgi:pimeloyl-CoA synthetase
VTASQVNYEVLRELCPVDRFDTSDEIAILKGSQERNEGRIHFIRKPVEINEFIQIVTKELQQEILGIEKIRCYKKIESKRIRQQQY